MSAPVPGTTSSGKQSCTSWNWRGFWWSLWICNSCFWKGCLRRVCAIRRYSPDLRNRPEWICVACTSRRPGWKNPWASGLGGFIFQIGLRRSHQKPFLCVSKQFISVFWAIQMSWISKTPQTSKISMITSISISCGHLYPYLYLEFRKFSWLPLSFWYIFAQRKASIHSVSDYCHRLISRLYLWRPLCN